MPNPPQPKTDNPPESAQTDEMDVGKAMGLKYMSQD